MKRCATYSFRTRRLRCDGLRAMPGLTLITRTGRRALAVAAPAWNDYRPRSPTLLRPT
ncbi:MAG: hypothetical protein J6J61_03310 [Muribaculaceae bacterium]|nr:hypothetical protein [Muribaculaceae bacterium]